MTTSSNVKGIIHARSDMVQRAVQFLIITPIVLTTAYRYMLEAIMQEELGYSDISWLMINATGFVILILGSVFMRGHNNRYILMMEILLPSVFWYTYLNLGKWFVLNNMLYLGIMTGPVLYGIFTIFMYRRIKIETKMHFAIGKWVAPFLRKCLVALGCITGLVSDKSKTVLFRAGDKVCEGLQKHAIYAAKSKGTTNLQMYIMTLYLMCFTVWTIGALWAVINGIYFEIGFFHDTVNSGVKLSALIQERWSFDFPTFMTTTVYDWVNSIWGLGMIYYIFTDYNTPDQYGKYRRTVDNYIGSGAKRLEF